MGSEFDSAERGKPLMKEGDLLRLFEEQRPRLQRVAYAIVGSHAEAEDCVQEAWLRLQRVKDPAEIRDLAAFLTTTVGRLALDALGSARVRREQYVGTWLPEPLVEEWDAGDPAERIALDESVSMALLVVLERLSAAERTAFLLHDVFGLSFDEVASVVNRSPAAVRKLASRARTHVEEGRPRFAPTHAEQRELVTAFAAACQEGDLEKLVSLLDPEVVWRGDGGGKVPALARTLQGSETVARALLGFSQRAFRGGRIAIVNGAPGLVLNDPDDVLTVISFTVDGGRIAAIDAIRNPDKLTSVPVPDRVVGLPNRTPLQ
ncbi:RNA polymerase sigma factor SigJ [Cohnella zeiphila]|uniref:RNA polymerase sigma factor SigJ n=1 Tax=Cohnella zeiphila TaxID=2761120 RepID=A0A7X0ST56_9BACL|nr:RNA polymerase sigma factor SigJ [Cohnella zeiphila]MBB6735642.1 RNA polymerase sigma factor SigJ [Cohnella zeiphila]